MSSIKLPKLFTGIVKASVQKEWLSINDSNSIDEHEYYVEADKDNNIIVYSIEREELYKGKLEIIDVNDFIYNFYKINQVFENGVWTNTSNYSELGFADTWEFEVKSIISVEKIFGECNDTNQSNELDEQQIYLKSEPDKLEQLEQLEQSEQLDKSEKIDCANSLCKISNTIKFMKLLLSKLEQDNIIYKEISDFIKYLED